MEESNGRRLSPLSTIFLFVLVVVVPLAVGLFMAERVVPAPQVGIVRLNYDINPVTAFDFRAQMEAARREPGVRAVVVVINSPGGTASDSEEMYLDVLHTRRQMPVVASVDFLAASGAYFVAAGADEVYAKTGSAIGSIGVIGVLPGPTVIEEDIFTTGPFKSSAFSRDARARQVETLKFSFLEAVVNGRGDRLSVTPEFLSRGEIYNGVQAVEYGLIDGVIATDEAVQRAAELAGLRDYETVELFELAYPDEEEAEAVARTIDLERLWAMPEELAPGIYYRYVVLQNQ
jgi:protease-4